MMVDRHFLKVLSALCGIALLGLTMHTLAQAQSHPRGAFKGFKNSVRALAISSSGDILAGTFGSGMYRSRNGGLNWEKISEGLTDPYILTIVSGEEDEIYTGTARKGVYRSADNGDHWTSVNSGLKNTEVPVILIQGKTVYAGTGDGIFRSTNRGKQWESYKTGMERILVRTLIIDQRKVLFAGTEGKGLFELKPGSSSWSQLTRGFGGEIGILDNFIRTLAIDSRGTMYAGTFDGGVYISADQGKVWSWWSAGMTNQSVRAVVIGADDNIFVGTGRGVFVRAPSDSEWKLLTQDLEDSSIQSMIVDDTGNIYAGTTSSLFKRDIKGEWTTVTPGLSQVRQIEKGPVRDPKLVVRNR